jgi:hypothetical protein
MAMKIDSLGLLHFVSRFQVELDSAVSPKLHGLLVYPVTGEIGRVDLYDQYLVFCILHYYEQILPG